MLYGRVGLAEYPPAGAILFAKSFDPEIGKRCLKKTDVFGLRFQREWAEMMQLFAKLQAFQ